MNGKDHFDRVRCNWCASEFDEEHILKNENDEEYCPVCFKKGCLMNVGTIHCNKCGYHLALSEKTADEFITTHNDGDCYDYGEAYYLYKGKFYCEECWKEMQQGKEQ